MRPDRARRHLPHSIARRTPGGRRYGVSARRRVCMQESQLKGRRLYARLVVLSKSGEPGRPITIGPWARSVRCSTARSQTRGPGLRRVLSDRIVAALIGIDVTGVQVTITRHTQSICFESNGSHNIFERLTMHDGQAIGIYHVHGRDNLFSQLRCLEQLGLHLRERARRKCGWLRLPSVARKHGQHLSRMPGMVQQRRRIRLHLRLGICRL